MTKMIALAVVSSALLTLGCATERESIALSVSGGYSETKLAPGTWRVLVEGSGFATSSEIEQFLMRRCAELTLEQGKRYFVLSDHDTWTDTQPTESGFVTSPTNEVTVTTLDAREISALDAVEIIRTTDTIADGELSARARKTLDVLIGSTSSPRNNKSQFRMATVDRGR